MELLKSAIITFLASLFCIWILEPIAIRIGLVDHPTGRKWHEKHVPLIGGIALFFSFFF